MIPDMLWMFPTKEGGGSLTDLHSLIFGGMKLYQEQSDDVVFNGQLHLGPRKVRYSGDYRYLEIEFGVYCLRYPL